MFKRYLFLIFLLGYTIHSQAQSETIHYQFNMVDYFAPAGTHSSQVSKTSYLKTDLFIDLNNKSIDIEIFYPDGSVNSIYTIKRISELKNVANKGYYYTFTCIASNSSEVIIDVSKEGLWASRVITHNGIKHKFYIKED